MTKLKHIRFYGNSQSSLFRIQPEYSNVFVTSMLQKEIRTNSIWWSTFRNVREKFRWIGRKVCSYGESLAFTRNLMENRVKLVPNYECALFIIMRNRETSLPNRVRALCLWIQIIPNNPIIEPVEEIKRLWIERYEIRKWITSTIDERKTSWDNRRVASGMKFERIRFHVFQPDWCHCGLNRWGFGRFQCNFLGIPSPKPTLPFHVNIQIKKLWVFC